MNTCKCPKCDKPISFVVAQAIPIRDALVGGKEYDGLALTCPSCHTVISVGQNPAVQKRDIAEAVARLI